MEQNHSFTAFFKMFSTEGLQISFGVGADSSEEHITRLHSHITTLLALGYSVNLPGVEDGETIYKIDGYVLGETKSDDPCVYLYSPGMKWRVATVYIEKVGELPFKINTTQRWPGGAPEREMAEKKGFLQKVNMFEIVMSPSGKLTEEGKPILKFDRVYGAKAAAQPAPAPAQPSQNGNGHKPAPASQNGNGHKPAPAKPSDIGGEIQKVLSQISGGLNAPAFANYLVSYWSENQIEKLPDLEDEDGGVEFLQWLEALKKGKLNISLPQLRENFSVLNS